MPVISYITQKILDEKNSCTSSYWRPLLQHELRFQMPKQFLGALWCKCSGEFDYSNPNFQEEMRKIASDNSRHQWNKRSNAN